MGLVIKKCVAVLIYLADLLLVKEIVLLRFLIIEYV